MPVQSLPSILESFNDGQHSVTVSDARARDMPLIYVSPGFTSFSGYSRAEVLGRNCRFLQGGLSDQPGLVTLRRAIAMGTGCTVDLMNFRKDGTKLANRLSLHPVFAQEGDIRYFVGLQTDVSALAELRNRLSDHFAAKGLRLA